MVVSEPVQLAIWQCLNHYNYVDAVFLSERLYAEACNDESLYLLATSYYQARKPEAAYSLLMSRGLPTTQCRYLAAQCCIQLNRLAEAEAALTGNCQKGKNFIEDITIEFGELSCYVLRLLADIYSKTDNIMRAVECYQKSLVLNPFLWSCYQSLCDLGEKPDVTKTFQVSANVLSLIGAVQFSDSVLNLQEKEPLSVPIYIDPAVTPDPSQNCGSVAAENTELLTSQHMPGKGAVGVNQWRSCGLFTVPCSLSPLTPSFGVLPLDNTPTPHGQLACSQGHFKVRGVTSSPLQSNTVGQLKPPVFSQSGNTNSNLPGGLRRSSRLFSNTSGSSVKENNKNGPSDVSKVTSSSPRAPTKKLKSKQQLSYTPQQMNDRNKPDAATMTTAVDIHSQQRRSADNLMSLLQEIASAYQSLSQYSCRQAVIQFNSLPAKHRQTAWVLCQIGRAHFELADYRKADEVYSEVRRLVPYYIDGMEVYSTVLWHLQSEMSLSALTQELTDFNKQCPQAWCAAGNCFSLQKDHEIAIRYFQRAVQVDPNFAYAYTLLGHEYVLIDELDKALCAFRNAIRINPRHYNAWYGVGMVYHKQEKFLLAEYHFNKALSINPQSSALLCNIGVVQHALKKSDKALSTLDKAIALDPRNPLCKFHRASILFATEKHKEALVELEDLKEIVPKESLVYFLMAKVHKKLGNTHLALINFSWATDLDPKGTNNHLKETLDKRYMVDDDDDDDDDISNISASDHVVDAIVNETASSHLVTTATAASNVDFQHVANETDESL